MFIDVVNIGYSPDELIPENNVINLGGILSTERPRLSCFTTQGYENPVWIVSNDDFSSDPLMSTGTVTIALGGGNITIATMRRSLYQSEIFITANSINFTGNGNLTCQSQNNSEAQYSIIVTTSKSVSLFLCMNVTCRNFRLKVQLPNSYILELRL